MIVALLSHQWKSFIRSRGAGASMALNILIGFILLQVVLSAVVFGVAMPSVIAEFFPGQNATTVFCDYLLYYFAIDMVLRFLLQELPTLSVQPYLLQNVKRSKLVSFLNVRSLLSLFNILPVLFFFPFALYEIRAQYGSVVALSFIVSIIAITVFNHFLILFIKRKTVVSSWWLVGIFVIIILLFIADQLGYLPIHKFSALIFTSLLHLPWLCVVPVVLAVLSFYNNYLFLYRNLYLEELSKGTRQGTTVEYTWLRPLGMVGDLIAVDIKLILRNKRPRYAILSYLLLMVVYGRMLLRGASETDNATIGTATMAGLIITGYFLSSYGQLLFAWQSSHFDGMMAGKINIKLYLRSKFILLTGATSLVLLPAFAFGIFNWKTVPILLATYLFNIGIHSILSIYFATYKYQAIDIGKMSMFDTKGIGAIQWLYALALFALAAIFYLPAALLFNPWAGVVIMGVAGLISLLLWDRWLDMLVNEFSIRKHKIAEGFREKV